MTGPNPPPSHSMQRILHALKQRAGARVVVADLDALMQEADATRQSLRALVDRGLVTLLHRTETVGARRTHIVIGYEIARRPIA